MAVYEYECYCGLTEREFPLGEARPTIRCEHGHLARRHYSMPQIAPSALEHKGAQARTKNMVDREWDKDRPAYKRMRDRGLHPKHIRGSAALEDKVDSDTDITFGHLYGHDDGAQRVREAVEMVSETNREYERKGTSWVEEAREMTKQGTKKSVVVDGGKK